MNFEIEESFGDKIILGIDEVGRGSVAGCVLAACVFLEKDFLKNKICKQINDSKKISKKKRREIYEFLIKNVKFGVGIVDEKIIDEINILNATKLAMLRAYQDFCTKYQLFAKIILVDGNFIPFKKQDEIQEIIAIIKGDQKSLSIACASIIAKEIRDEIMSNLHQKYPQFSWDKNAAYLTKFHIEKIKEFGFCEFHRKSFEPIKSMVNNIENAKNIRKEQ